VNTGTLLPLGLFCGLVSIVLYLFWGYHMYLVIRNTTTNETFKWDDYHRYVNYFIKKQKEAVETANKTEENVKKTKKVEDDPPPPKYELDKKGKPIIKNIYNRGIINNFVEVFSPPSFRGTSAKQSTKASKSS
jgi:hypothetical protein